MMSYSSVNTCDKCKSKILKTMAKRSLVDEYDDVSESLGEVQYNFICTEVFSPPTHIA